MPDEPTQPSPAVAEPKTDTTTPADADARSSRRAVVSVPPWLAAALVVLLGLAIGAAGFAIGRVTDNGHGGPRPAVFGRGPGPGPGGGLGGFGPRRSGGGFGGFGGGIGPSGGASPATPTTPTTAA